MGATIDLNADVGEGVGGEGDEPILRVVTTAHIACGFHAGGPELMRETVESALRHGVAIGAHPSYDDREGFGRRPLDVPVAQIRDALLYQVGALDAIVRASGGHLTSVKPHGALYNRMATDAECAATVARAVRDLDADMWLVAAAGSPGAEVCRALGVQVAEEAFCDRAYARDGTLVARTRKGAVIGDPLVASQRALRLVRDHEIDSIDGDTVRLRPQTLCVHGDTPGAATVASSVRRVLAAAGVVPSAFSGVRA